MNVARVNNDSYTINDILNLPEGKHVELIEGTAYDMAPPNPRHQQIAFSIARKIADYIDKNNGSCEVYPAPFGVFLSEEDNTYLEPDISVICDKSKISERGCEGAPDWIIEVVSSTAPDFISGEPRGFERFKDSSSEESSLSSKSMDYLRKLYQYKQKCVRLYWIVDPASGYVSVYDFENDTMAQYGFNDSIPVAIYDDLEIDMASV